MKQQSGFTLIELVVVIVLLGILGAAATAKFQDLRTEAYAATVKGVAGELASASSINFGRAAAGTATTAATGAGPYVFTSCAAADANNLMQQGNVFGAGAGQYTIAATNGGETCTATGEVMDCDIDAVDDTASFTETVRLICTAATP